MSRPAHIKRRHVCAIMLVALVVTTMFGSDVLAQNDGTGGATTRKSEGRLASEISLGITSISPWVSSEGEFQVRFAASQEIPENAQLTYTIHQSLNGTSKRPLRDQIAAIIEGGTTGKILQAPVTRPLASYGNPAAGAVLTIPIRSRSSADRTRAFLPNAGVHPVELVLTSADGPELWSQVVFLNRLPRNFSAASSSSSGDDESPQVEVTLLLPIQAAAALDSNGDPKFSTQDRSNLQASAGLLNSQASSSLTVAARPDTVNGLSMSDEPWATNVLDSLTSALTKPLGGSSSVARRLRLPFVKVDTGALAAAKDTAALPYQLELGERINADITSSGVVDKTWALDDSVTESALPLLSNSGVDSVVLPASRLRLSDDDGSRAMTSPFRLGGGGNIRALAYDSLVSRQLADTNVDPAVRAHDVVALLVANWFGLDDMRSATTAASVILVPPTTEPAVIEALAPSLSGTGPLILSSGDSLLPPPPNSDDEAVFALAHRGPRDISSTLEAAAESRRRIESIDSMTEGAEPRLDLWRLLISETFAEDMSADQRLLRHATVRTEINEKLGAVVPPPARRVLLGRRDPSIPLRFRNDLPYEIKIVLYARSPRLDVDGSDTRVLTLDPGENRVDLPVEVQAPGESLLRLEVSTPDGELQMRGTRIPVQSTAISGVGAALSVISLLFLLIWWFRTLRRRRRESSRGDAHHPSTTGSVVNSG